MTESIRQLMIETASIMLVVAALIITISFRGVHSQMETQQQQQQQQSVPFPGVTRELAPFCAARPSLPIDLAPMIVHVKKNTSFNYKLYLFSSDHVFQTGQVIPRDDFRIHAFPVKLKRLNEFWPASVATFRRTSSSSMAESLVPVSSSEFNLKKFLALVPLNPKRKLKRPKKSTTNQNKRKMHLFDVHGEALPGDPEFARHDVAFEPTDEHEGVDHSDDDQDNINKHIKFDRDDQVLVAHRSTRNSFRQYNEMQANSETESSNREESQSKTAEFFGQPIMPVSSFSSFHVNRTYFVRKDFGQLEPELIRVQIDASKFVVTQVHLIHNATTSHTNSTTAFPQHEDYEFLSHKLLRDPNTRITAVNQIYEDWITRNYYTIVYIQRQLDEDERGEELSESSTLSNQDNHSNMITDRLVFRGSSLSLLGADQLDYDVKAAAFITEKNGLHYYFEFLASNKFYLGAIDWTKRPFRIIDSRQYPIKATRAQLDNEELLLCPPAVCYSNQPIDEVIGYGRIPLPDKIQREAVILSSSTSFNSKKNSTKLETDHLDEHSTHELGVERLPKPSAVIAANGSMASISLDAIIEAIQESGAQIETKLHLRDWVWTLPRASGTRLTPSQSIAAAADKVGGKKAASKFAWRYELARRNDMKVSHDTYGYGLTGHEIDASYRIYNELYLISSNHLITINYTLANETVTSKHPISDEFYGLSSTLVDPITGAFYDRYANHIFFFKGDRYIGYDYASKKPLEDFALEAPGYVPITLVGETMPLVSSLPVIGILGRQHYVDGVYHDLLTDTVYIFSGMKFYYFQANEFKDGSFKSTKQPAMFCINQFFLDGCHFDEAFPNPCQIEESSENKLENEQQKSNKLLAAQNDNEQFVKTLNFSQEQQLRLRNIASRGKLLDILMGSNNLLSKSATQSMEPFMGSSSPSSPEKVVIFLLVAMVVITIIITIGMIVVIINWTRVKTMTANGQQEGQQASNDMVKPSISEHGRGHQYLKNQHHHSRRHPYLHNPGQREDPLAAAVVVTKTRRHNRIDSSAL